MNTLIRIARDLSERGCISAEDFDAASEFFGREGEMRAKAQKFIGEGRLSGSDLKEKLAVTLCAADIARVRYAERGIPESIFYDTMSDIGVWTAQARRDGEGEGLSNTPWLLHHVRLELFKLGRLQFQPIKRPIILDMGCALKTARMLPKLCLNVHIPRGGKLDLSACEASLYGAPMFFEKYFRQSYSAFCCLSWLLYPGNKAFMKEKSNILAFSRLFEVIGEKKYDGDALYYIFGARKIDPESITPQTSLQASALEYYKSGGAFGLGFGVRNAQKSRGGEGK